MEPIARLIHGYLQRDSYAGLVGLRHENEIGEAPSVPVSKVGEWRLRRFETEAEVFAALMNMGDPFVPTDFFTIRSMISCRSVMYGYDAQAFLCLRTEDEAPASPDPSLILVEERPDLLLQTDYLDGAEAALDDDGAWAGSP
ncbi:MAG: hypothetical protein EON86_17030 [Brevundimonas sp.]|nr:MAG: hypothetical protein EON86_17030 [Brevundimonas sp.]